MIEVIAAPFDGSGARLGSRLGPAALDLAGIAKALQTENVPITAWHDLTVLKESEGFQERGDQGLRQFEPLLDIVIQIRERALAVLEAGNLPLLLGGEHSVAIGGVSAALTYTRGDLALLWIDAHADLNTPDHSPSGNIHGMPIAALAGLPSAGTGLVAEQWKQLVQSVAVPGPLPLGQCAWIGLRDVDAGEQDTLIQHPDSLPITMQDIDRHGVLQVMGRVDRWLRASGVRNLYVSFDVDALDPALAPGTGTAVRGGLTYREGHLIAELLDEMLHERDCPYRLVGLDLVEVNPLEDTHNTTAKMAVEWLASLFGKKIMGKQR
jgi:arginase